MGRMKELEAENARLKKMYADGNGVSLPRGFAPEEVLRDEGALGRVFCIFAT